MRIYAVQVSVTRGKVYQSSLHWMKTSSRSPEDALTETSRSANRMTRQDHAFKLHCRINIVRPVLPGTTFPRSLFGDVEVSFLGVAFSRCFPDSPHVVRL
jgi:hypothetical protein